MEKISCSLPSLHPDGTVQTIKMMFPGGRGWSVLSSRRTCAELLWVSILISTVGAQTTTPSPTSETDTGFLSRDVIFWIIIGIGSLLGVTCVFLFIFACIVWCNRRARKRKFRINRPPPLPIHGDAIRGLFTGSRGNDPAVQTPQFTAGGGPGVTVIDDSAQILEMIPVSKEETTDDTKNSRDTSL